MQRAFLISFGLGGHGIEITDTLREGSRTKGRISGYDSPESFERSLVRGDKKEYPPLAHVPVLDKRPALRTNPVLGIKSPLVDVELEAGKVERLDASAARSMLPGLSGGFEVLAALAIANDGKPEPGPLDSVSLADYLEWWRSRGARLGRMDGEGLHIVWQDEKEAP